MTKLFLRLYVSEINTEMFTEEITRCLGFASKQSWGREGRDRRQGRPWAHNWGAGDKARSALCESLYFCGCLKFSVIKKF